MKRPLAILAILALAACGRKPQDPSLQFTFTLYGDSRLHDDVHRRICESMLKTGPKFVVTTGDLVGDGDTEEHWQRFRDITKDLRAKAAYYTVMGDHDLGSKHFFEKEFGLEKLWYDVRVEGIHFFMLHSMGDFKEAEQIQWLEERASASDALHKIAVFHHPPFINDPDRAKAAEVVRGRIHPLLVKLKFCAAFCGHEHAFYTTVRDGIRYVVTGGGGANLFKLDKASAQPGDLWRTFYHYVGCRIDGRRITAQVVDDYGQPAGDLAFTVCEH